MLLQIRNSLADVLEEVLLLVRVVGGRDLKEIGDARWTQRVKLGGDVLDPAGPKILAGGRFRQSDGGEVVA